MLALTGGLLAGLLLLSGFGLRYLLRQRRACLLQARVVAATGCSVVVTDATVPRHPVLYANPAFRLLTGYARDEVIGQSLTFLNGLQTDRSTIEKLALALQDGRACRVVVRHYRKNGTPFWNEVTLSPVKNRAGRVTEYIWVMSDVTQRQQAEDTVKDASALSTTQIHAHLQSTQAVAHVGSWEWNIEDGTEIWSDEQYRIFGLEPGSIRPTHETFAARLHPDDRARVLAAIDSTLHAEQPYDVECRIVRPDGDIRFVHYRGRVERDAAGRPLRMSGTVQDATERKLMEQVAEERELQFKRIVESAPCGILAVQEDGTITLVNAQIEHMFGYSRDEVLGRPVEMLIPELVQPFHGNHRRSCFSLPAARTMGAGRELSGMRKDGTEFPLEISLTPVRTSSGTTVLASIVDISARRQAEQAIRDSQERLDLVVQAAHVGIFEHDHRTDRLYWSPILRAIYGVGEEEPASLQRYIELIPREERDAVLQALRNAHDPAGDGRFEVEHRLTRPDGRVRSVRVRSETRFGGEGVARTPVCTIGSVVDITDCKLAEAQMRKVSKMEAIGTLAGGIAHEFNNSLTAVLGFSELALPLIPAESKAHRHIEQVIVAGRKSRELVHQLLTFSRPSDQIRHPLSLSSLVKESLKLLRPTIPTWIELRERIAGSTRPIMADPTQMHQLILHLVENALQAMRQTGGVLGIELQDRELAADLLTPAGRVPAGHYACLTVRDSGAGLEPEVASRIFDPSLTAKSLGEGRSIGLSVAHGIVTNHGGTVLVESRPGSGTAVSVYLPVSPPLALSASQHDSPLPRGHECVLFVDDEASLARFGGEMLESLGYYPVVRLSAAQAWEAFQVAPQRFDLLITDQIMPGMSGDALARKCRRLRPDLPIILCTGSGQSLSEEAARASGVTEYLVKPLMLHDLAQTIRRALDAPRPSAAQPDRGTHLPVDLVEEPDAVSARR